MWIATGDKPWLLGIQPDMSAMEGDPMMGEMEVLISFKGWKTDSMEASEFATTPEEDWAKVDDIMAAIMAKANEMQASTWARTWATWSSMNPRTDPGHGSRTSLKTLRSAMRLPLVPQGKVVVLDSGRPGAAHAWPDSRPCRR